MTIENTGECSVGNAKETELGKDHYEMYDQIIHEEIKSKPFSHRTVNHGGVKCPLCGRYFIRIQGITSPFVCEICRNK